MGNFNNPWSKKNSGWFDYKITGNIFDKAKDIIDDVKNYDTLGHIIKGSVIFSSNIDIQFLSDFALIPEDKGEVLITPTELREYKLVDGFFWKYESRWFKIPNGCHLYITSVKEKGFTHKHTIDRVAIMADKDIEQNIGWKNVMIAYTNPFK